jgi:hypothetical protein
MILVAGRREEWKNLPAGLPWLNATWAVWQNRHRPCLQSFHQFCLWRLCQPYLREGAHADRTWATVGRPPMGQVSFRGLLEEGSEHTFTARHDSEVAISVRRLISGDESPGRVDLRVGRPSTRDGSKFGGGWRSKWRQREREVGLL